MKIEWECKYMEEDHCFLLSYWEHILQGKFLEFLLLYIERNNKTCIQEFSISFKHIQFSLILLTTCIRGLIYTDGCHVNS